MNAHGQKWIFRIGHSDAFARARQILATPLWHASNNPSTRDLYSEIWEIANIITSEGSFSAVPHPIFPIEYSFCRILGCTCCSLSYRSNLKNLAKHPIVSLLRLQHVLQVCIKCVVFRTDFDEHLPELHEIFRIFYQVNYIFENEKENI